ncbi:O-antigen ligase family protein [Catellatospora sp. NPDC049609]|uniref:O-antigen ligase family protein n=1 Tax=Catellatospora sp. NPDC049609 TaxID=3155505 RepID=UPI003412F701
MNDRNPPPAATGAGRAAGSRQHRARRGPGPISRGLSLVILLAVAATLAEVLLSTESGLLGRPAGSFDLDAGTVQIRPADLILIVLTAATLLKILVDRSWGRLRSGADLALLAVVLVMVLSAVVNDVAASLAGPALLTYVRGIAVFYALRVVDTSWAKLGAILAIPAALLAANVGAALAQLALGSPAYRAVGHDDLAWADQDRVQGLLAHPQQLGYALGLALLGLTAWLAVRDRVGPAWWLAVAGSAVALAATYSWESVAAALAGVVLVAVLLRAHRGRVLAVGLILLTCTAAAVAVRPGTDRPAPAASAAPTGAATSFAPQPDTSPAPGAADDRRSGVMEAVQKLQSRPLLGHGTGRSAEIVAVDGAAASPPGTGSGQLDSFWLRLVVETGLMGLIVYLVWLFAVARDLLTPTAPAGVRGPRPVPDTRAVWAVAAVLFAALASVVSPALADPVLPALLWTVAGVAWWARQHAQAVQSSVASAETAMLPRIRDVVGNMNQTEILSKDAIAAYDPESRQR